MFMIKILLQKLPHTAVYYKKLTPTPRFNLYR